LQEQLKKEFHIEEQLNNKFEELLMLEQNELKFIFDED